MSTRHVVTTALLSALALAGCSSESTQPTPSAGLRFVGADPGAGPAVYLRAGSSTATSISLQVMGRALPNVYGLAFRLQDPSGVITLSGLTPSSSWSATALSVAREPVAGLIVAGLSERGSAVGFAATDDLLGTLDLQLSAGPSVPLYFVDAECAVAQASGGELASVTWLGGLIEPR